MWKRIKNFFKGWFRGGFIHPALDQNLNMVIDDKVKSVREKQAKLSDKHTDILNSYLRTYFSKQYSTTQEMAVAYDVADKAWKKHCRTINSTERLINLNKNAFATQVQAVVNQVKEGANQQNK